MTRGNDTKAEGIATAEILSPGDLTRLGLLLDMAPAVERQFEADTRAEQIALARVAIPFGLLFHNLHNFITLVFMRDVFLVGVALRLGLITSVGLVIAWALPLMSARMREAMFCLAMLGVVSVSMFLLWYSTDPNACYTTSEFFLALVYGGMILQIRFPSMMLLVSVAVAEASVVFAAKTDLPVGTSGGFILQILTGAAFTLYGNYHVERSRRRSYLRTVRETARSERLEADKTLLTALSSCDSLTGLANRRALDAALAAALVADFRGSVALLMIDIDHFKLFNDTYGHIEGDRCLHAVAQALTPPPWVGRSLVARYGGEEFAILLPGLDLAGAQFIGETMRSTVQALGLAHAGRTDGPTMVTVSVGVAAASVGDGADPVTLLGEADAGLYAAKRLGRNRCAARREIVSRGMEDAAA